VRLRRLHHRQRAPRALRLPLRQQVQVRRLGRREQLRRAVRAAGHAGTAADAGGCVHRAVGVVLRHGDRVGVRRGARRRGDVPAGLDDAVEGRAVDDEVLDQREGRRPERLDDDLLAVGEAPQMQLAGRRAALGAMGLPVDHDPAGPADALAAIALESDRLGALGDQALVEQVQQLDERHLVVGAVDLVVRERARRIRAGLTPDLQLQPHL
jgi:hypothetical protein